MKIRIGLCATAALALAGTAGAQTTTGQRTPEPVTTVATPGTPSTPATTGQSTPMTAGATTGTLGTTANPATTGAPGATSAATPATPNPSVGGAAMLDTRTIVDNAAAAPNLSTLVTAVKGAGLDTTLAGPGPFTVFAPTNAAFGRVPAETLATLMKPENKESLAKVLNYHVVPGRLDLAELRRRMEAGGGTATLTTAEGETLTVTETNGAVELTDVNGNKSYVQTPDVRQSNGVVHVVNGLLIPKLG